MRRPRRVSEGPGTSRKEPEMQPGEEIESLVDELESIVADAKSPFTGGGAKKIVDAQGLAGVALLGLVNKSLKLRDQFHIVLHF